MIEIEDSLATGIEMVIDRGRTGLWVSRYLSPADRAWHHHINNEILSKWTHKVMGYLGTVLSDRMRAKLGPTVT